MRGPETPVGAVVHFEIPLDDVERGQEFYKKTFGWHLDVIPEMNYAMVRTTDSDAEGRPKTPGAINGGMAKREAPLHQPTITIMVDSIEASLKAVEMNGGKSVQPRTPIGDGSIGFSAYFRDSEGNVIGLFEANKA